MKRLAQRNADVASPILRCPEGTYSKLYIILEGTSDTSDIIDLDELGRVTASYNGRTFIGNVRAKNIMHFGNLKGGRVECNIPSAGATKVCIPIFCHEPDAGVGNVLHVTDDDNVTFEMNWGTGFTGDLASGNVSLYGDIADGVMDYLFTYDEYDFPLAAAGSIHERLPGENFTHVMVTNVDDVNMTLIQLEVDGKMLHYCTAFAARAGSNFRNNIGDVGGVDADTAMAQQVGGSVTGEITSSEVAEFPIYNGQWSEALTDDLTVIINADGDIGTPSVMLTQLDFTPERAARSEAMLRGKIQTAINRKRHLGKGRPVTAYEGIKRRTTTPLNISPGSF